MSTRNLKESTLTVLSDLEVLMVRTFSAPRAKVFAAHARPEHLKRWWGRGNPLDVEMDFRPGGRYRFVEHAPDGESHAFRGEYLEIVEPERIVYTFEYEGLPGHVCVATLELAEVDGTTTLSSTTRFENVADRDGMVESGMKFGADQSHRALDALLTTL